VTRVDAHMHFWRYDPREYSWIDAGMAALRRDYLPSEARPLLDERHIDACIAVQARVCAGETDFLLGLAAANPWIAAVIGWVDLADERLEQQLGQWSGARRLAGFRHVLQNDAGAGERVDSSEFRRGVRLLQQRSMIYEILISADQLPLVKNFCGALDGHWLVLDHLGKPDIRGRRLYEWIRDLAPLARLPHVACKLSGLVTEANDTRGDFDEAHLHEYLDAAYRLFGPERVMFGSDWPVCTLVAGYARTAQVLNHWSAQLPASDRERLWGANAARIYALGERA